MFCKNCGAQLNDDAKFCPKCGATMNGAQGQAQQPPQAQPYGQGYAPTRKPQTPPPSIKTKVGVSAGIIAAIAFLSALIGGGISFAQNAVGVSVLTWGSALVVNLLIVGYVLHFEENTWLRKTVVKSAVMVALFLACTVVLNLIPDLMIFINDMLLTFGEAGFGTSSAFRVIVGIFGMLGDIVYIGAKVLFLLLGIFAIGGRTIRIPLVDSLVEKYVK